MISSRLCSMISVAYAFGFFIKSNCQLYNKSRQLFYFDPRNLRRIKFNACLISMFTLFEPVVIWKLRQQNKVDLYNLHQAFYFGGCVLVLVYGIPTFYTLELTQAVNSYFVLFRYLHRKLLQIIVQKIQTFFSNQKLTGMLLI